MNENEKIASAVYFEGITSIKSVIRGAESGVSDRKIETIYFDKNAKASKSRELSYINKMKEKHGFDLVFCDRDDIDALSVGTTHGGIIAKCTDRTFKSSLPDNINEKNFIVMLEGIEDPFNFGYAMRSLYAFGVDAVILPERNWMSAAPIVCRSSAGASELMDIYSLDCEKAVNTLKNKGFKIIATAKENSESISDIDIDFPLLLIVGGEKRGISKKILNLADATVRIDYSSDFLSSLSAASAAAILGYEVSKRMKEKNI